MAIAQLRPRFPMFFLDKIGEVLGFSGGSVTPTATKVPPELMGLINSTMAGGSGLSKQLAQQGGGLVNQGLGQLGDVLGREGKLDPTLMNFQLSDIAKGTTGAQDAARASGAASGFQAGSGVDQAVQAAIGAGGADRRAGLIAEEARAEDMRQKQALQLLVQMVMNPQLAQQGISAQLLQALLGVNSQDAQQANMINLGNAQANDAMIGGLLNAGAKGASLGMS